VAAPSPDGTTTAPQRLRVCLGRLGCIGGAFLTPYTLLRKMAAREPRFFTLEEANALVPRVNDLLQALQHSTETLQSLQARLEDFRARKREGDHADEARITQDALTEATSLAEEMRASLTELREIGCEIKDVRTGLVDFPSLRENRTVYLCWRLGEDEIRYWHELDAGFAGRQAL
jgi:hypothetical protein